MSILNKIVDYKKQEIEKNRSLYPIALLQSSKFFESPTVSFSKYIGRSDKSGIIAEFKRRSPSKPEINLYAEVEAISIGYMQAGASALSILTDKHFFGGQNNDLSIARSFNFCPILRKDFIIDPYQVIESRSIGADAILLIASILNKQEVDTLSSLAKSLGMEVLLEIHTEEELLKLNEHIDVVGVNNRDLNTFRSDINHSIAIAPKLPKGPIRISESGIQSAEQMHTLKDNGYDGFLIGEQFMKTADPAKACRMLISKYQQLKKA